MYVCIYIYIYTHSNNTNNNDDDNAYICTYEILLYIVICMYVCIYIYIYRRPIWLREVPRTASHFSHDLSPQTADDIVRGKGQSFKLVICIHI